MRDFTGNGQELHFGRKAVTQNDGWRRICRLQQNLTNTTIVFVLRNVLFRITLVGRVTTVERTRLARAPPRVCGLT